MGQPHEVRRRNGAKIDWKHPPKATEMCRWTKETSSGKVIIGSLFTLAHMNRLNNLAIRKFDTQLTIFQGPFNRSVAASAGTHDFDCVWDWWINGVPAYTQQRFGRTNGAATWYRHPPAFGNHQHSLTIPPHHGSVSNDYDQFGLKVGRFVDGGISSLGKLAASSQLADYYNHAFGLGGQHAKGSDRSWFPADIAKTVFDLKGYIARRAA